MLRQLSAVCAAFAAIAAEATADDRDFHKINRGAAILTVTPQGECAGVVTRRQMDSLTVRLTQPASPCGKQDSQIEIAKGDVTDVVNSARSSSLGRHAPQTCAKLGALAGLVLAERVGAATQSANALILLPAAGIAGALLCRDRGPKYTVFAGRLQAAGLPRQ